MKMRMLCLALWLATGVGMQGQTDLAKSETVLRGMIEAQRAAWNRGDGPAWASPFSQDAGFINIRGDAFTGREAVTKQHVFIFAGPFKGSHQEAKIDSIVFPTPGVAVIDVTFDVTRFAFLPPGVVATEPGNLRTRMKFIAKEENGKWEFIAVQNTAVLPRPPQGQFAPTGVTPR